MDQWLVKTSWCLSSILAYLYYFVFKLFFMYLYVPNTLFYELFKLLISRKLDYCSPLSNCDVGLTNYIIITVVLTLICLSHFSYISYSKICVNECSYISKCKQITDNISQNIFKTNCVVFHKIIQYYPHCSIAFLRKLYLRNAELSWPLLILKNGHTNWYPRLFVLVKIITYALLKTEIFLGI